jgi:phosphohistidine swiveling domain-containing protein
MSQDTVGWFARYFSCTARLVEYVVVAPTTDPGWMPLFVRAGVLVTEVGGYLSHCATVTSTA